MGVCFRCHELDIGLPGKIRIHVFLPHLDCWAVEESYAILLDHDWHTRCMLDLYNSQSCYHLSTFRRKNRSVRLPLLLRFRTLTLHS